MAVGSVGVLQAILKLKDEFTPGFAKFDKNVKAASKSVALATGAIAAVGVGIFKMTADVAAAGDEFHKMSRRTGVSADTLSRLGHAAGLAGTDIGTVEKALGRAARVISDASAGLATAQRPFEKLGINIRDTSGELIGVGDLLPQVADKLAELGSETERAATLQELFGRSGTQLLPLLRQGSAAIREQMEEAGKLGAVWSDTATDKAAAFVDAQARIKAAWEGIKKAFVLDFMPAFSDGMNRLAGGMAGFQEKAAAAGKAVGESLVPFLVSAVEKLMALVQFLAANSDKLVAFGKILAVAFAVRTVVQFGQAILGLKAAIAGLSGASAIGGLLPLLAGPAGLIALIGVGLAGAFIAAKRHTAEYNAEIQRTLEEVRAAKVASFDLFATYKRDGIEAIREFAQATKLTKDQIRELVLGLTHYRAEGSLTFTETVEIRKALEETTGSLARNAEVVGIATDAYAGFNSTADNTPEIMKRLQAASANLTLDFKDLSQHTVRWGSVQMPNLESAMNAMRIETARQAEELENLTGSTSSAADAARSSVDDWQGLTNAFQGIHPAADSVLGKFNSFLGLFSKIAGALSGLGGKFGEFFSKISGGAGGLDLGKMIGGLFGGGGAGEAGEAVGGELGSGIFDGLKGLLGDGKVADWVGKALNFLPVVGPLISALAGPMVKGISWVGKKVWAGAKAAFGWIGSIFGGPDRVKQVGEEAGKFLGVGLSDTLAKSLVETSKSLGGSRLHALFTRTGDIIREVGVESDDVFKKMATSALQNFNIAADGVIPISDAVRNAGDIVQELSGHVDGNAERWDELQGVVMNVASRVKDGTLSAADANKFYAQTFPILERVAAQFGDAGAAALERVRAHTGTLAEASVDTAETIEKAYKEATAAVLADTTKSTLEQTTMLTALKVKYEADLEAITKTTKKAAEATAGAWRDATGEMKDDIEKLRDDLADMDWEIELEFETDVPGGGGGGGRIPALHTGGIVRRPTLAFIGERGPEAVVPLPSRGIGGGVGDSKAITRELERLLQEQRAFRMELKNTVIAVANISARHQSQTRS